MFMAVANLATMIPTIAIRPCTAKTYSESDIERGRSTHLTLQFGKITLEHRVSIVIGLMSNNAACRWIRYSSAAGYDHTYCLSCWLCASSITRPSVCVIENSVRPRVRKAPLLTLDNLFGYDIVIQYLVSSSTCLLYTSPSPRDKRQSRMPSSA